jgi:DNA-binding NtrC family response regulator
VAHRLLVVDDEPSIRKVLAAQLGRHGYHVTALDDGAAAVAHLEQHDVDCIVTDLKMPKLDGMSLLAWIRTHRPGTPVVVITAFGTVETAVDALKMGAFDYVAKPFDQDELRATIADAITARAAAPPVVPPIPDDPTLDLKDFVRIHTARLERAKIRDALDAEGGNVTRAARRLGISRRSLQTKMKDYGLREG